MRFLYLRDPLFLFCVATYVVNRLILKPVSELPFLHNHLNDLICIPFWVPIMIYVQRRVGLRDGDDGPRLGELLIPLIVWSCVFEIILPRTGFLGDLCVADYRDIAFYALGTLGAGLFWSWWYSGGEAPAKSETAPLAPSTAATASAGSPAPRCSSRRPGRHAWIRIHAESSLPGPLNHR